MRRSGFALLGLLLAAPVVWAALRHHARTEETFDLVRAAASAHERVGYKGEAAWRRAKWNSSVEIVHDAESGRTRYHWSRWKKAYVTRRPSSRSPDPAAFCRDVDALTANYSAVERTRTRFLGRAARVIRLVPRHEGRPSAQLTLDAETALPLKVVTFRSDGSLYRVAAFRSIEIGPQVVAARDGERKGWSDWFGSSVPLERIDESLDFDPVLPEYVPEGFRCIDCRITGATVKRARLTFSDGLTAFDLSLGPVATPAQLRDDAVARFGERRADMYRRWARSRDIQRLVRTENASAGTTRVHRRDKGRHRSFELRVDRVDVKLTSRTDLAEWESERVLRSLRAR
ncbi:MAG: sigma-E factor regulatory protein RseB domain-containing protein [Planctomycetota bacterium]